VVDLQGHLVTLVVLASLGSMRAIIQWILLQYLVHMIGILSAGVDLPSYPYPVGKKPLNKKVKVVICFCSCFGLSWLKMFYFLCIKPCFCILTVGQDKSSFYETFVHEK
jgi:hypothetical protein